MVTRGLKATPYQNPKVTIGQPTIVIIPEHKVKAPPPWPMNTRACSTG
jgi:branched-chain amino acid aminotransferase